MSSGKFKEQSQCELWQLIRGLVFLIDIVKIILNVSHIIRVQVRFHVYCRESRGEDHAISTKLLCRKYLWVSELRKLWLWGFVNKATSSELSWISVNTGAIPDTLFLNLPTMNSKHEGPYFFPHYLLGLGTRRCHDDLEEKVDKILHKVSDITAKLHNLTDAVRKFEQCKAWGPIRGFRDTGYLGKKLLGYRILRSSFRDTGYSQKIVTYQMFDEKRSWITKYMPFSVFLLMIRYKWKIYKCKTNHLTSHRFIMGTMWG